jgi:glyoxylase-like metal-dependent hydrolase (beta-lactamase superfamily II)
MSTKPFASVADTEEKRATVEAVAEGVYAYTAEGDPNVGAIVGDDAVLVVDARATPVLANAWIEEIRRRTDRPIRHLLLSHYHAVRVLGASAYRAEQIVASTRTADLIEERGKADWDSELGRFPRLFAAAETIPGLSRPTTTFEQDLTIDLGGRVVELAWLGRGHTAGDAVAWVPDCGVLFAGDLVEAEAAPYMGDASIGDWRGATIDRVAAYEARALIGGRGPVLDGDAVATAVEDTRNFLSTTFELTAEVRAAGGTIKKAFDAVHAQLAPRYAGYPIFEHCMPFNVQRAWDEIGGTDNPIVWTAERDRAVWAELQA